MLQNQELTDRIHRFMNHKMEQFPDLRKVKV